ncbi:hypothetical protein A8950_0858 [Dongia mobilis]|uniref:Lipocalin-like protein n=1 Tax=Dongia mobilis TaxID=578943 RepID=A0A4R6X1H0_9PROT|nr:hypothetical protein [Dongia mobilis]TDQ84308.1 hypothetical protein A8950_0858 [Dongia mobilis]
MTRKLLLVGAVTLASLAGLAGTLLQIGPADAQEPFAGSWDVVDVVQAPWVEADYKGPVNAEIAQGRITFMAQAVQAPGFLNCDKARFEVAEVPAAFLFQGNLSDPARQAADLGHDGGDILNLAMTCQSGDADVYMDFSLLADDLLVFALDNMIYRLRRVAE